MLTTLIILSFALGFVAGLRSMTAPAAVVWGAYFGWLHLSGSKFAFVNNRLALITVTVLFLLELVVDKLPQTPARTAPIGLIARVLLGGLCGAALATNVKMSPLLAMPVASAGALVGAFAGYKARHALVLRSHILDSAVALAEDAIAITSGLLIVSRF